jgi:hypothetical protein
LGIIEATAQSGVLIAALDCRMGSGNPVKRGYVDLPEHWRYSSARAYMGQDSLLPVVLLY